MDDAIPMKNSKENSKISLVQRLFNKNVELENKLRKAAQARIPSDPSIWQQMRENYEAIILEDHAFSEQHDVEYALWQLHYRKIEELRSLFNAAVTSAGTATSQNGKVPGRSGPDRVTKIRSQLKTFLSEATGFYHDLMLKIRAKNGMPLGYFSDGLDNQIPLSKDGNKSSEMKKALISCHRSLIYLGDLARYKGLYGEGDSKAREFAAAASYYMQVSLFWPSSGNPHHQLAILAGYLNDDLMSIYRYFRSIAIDKPFTTARDNLIIAFEKNRQNYTLLVGDAKVTSAKPSRIAGKGRGKRETMSSGKENTVENSPLKERTSRNPELFKAFITWFVRLNGVLFTRTSLETFADVFSIVKHYLLELLSSGSDEEFNFGSDAAGCKLAIVRMIAILIFTVHNVNRESENQSYADILQRSVLLQNAFTATFELMGCILERCTQLNDPSSSYLLPGIMVFVEWLTCCPDVALGSELEEKQVYARSFFWKNCISLLNKLLSSGYNSINDDEDDTFFSNMTKYDESETSNRFALPEDSELRGFLPLLPAQLILDFSRNHSFGGDVFNKEKFVRMQRIIAAGKALVNVVRIGLDGAYFDSKLKKFVIGVEPQISDDYLLTSLDFLSNDDSLENSVGRKMALDSVPRTEILEAEDEEDEVIVFKPTTNEKHVEELTSSEALPNVGDFGFVNRPYTIGHDNFLLESALSASTRPSTTFANGTSHFLSPIQPSISKYYVDHVPLLNSLPNLSLMENVSSVKSELQDQFGVFQPAVVSLPYPHFANGHSFSTPIPEAAAAAAAAAAVLSDSIFSSGAVPNGLSNKPPAAMQPGLKKNPVSRPVRHIGPPPGFGFVPSKVETLTLKNENHAMPQKGGYQLSSSFNQNVGFSNSIQAGSAFHTVNKSNGSMAGFPFPGKQASTLQEYQFAENIKLYEQQGQSRSGNQQPVGNPQQYQGQSLWEGHFMV